MGNDEKATKPPLREVASIEASQDEIAGAVAQTSR